jgi:hypothetical protein
MGTLTHGITRFGMYFLVFTWALLAGRALAQEGISGYDDGSHPEPVEIRHISQSPPKMPSFSGDIGYSTPSWVFLGHTDGILSAAISPNGKRIATGTYRGSTWSQRAMCGCGTLPQGQWFAPSISSSVKLLITFKYFLSRFHRMESLSLSRPVYNRPTTYMAL